MIYIGKHDLGIQIGRPRPFFDKRKMPPMYSIQLLPFPVEREWLEVLASLAKKGIIRLGTIRVPTGIPAESPTGSMA